jgi:hypothetical protein
VSVCKSIYISHTCAQKGGEYTYICVKHTCSLILKNDLDGCITGHLTTMYQLQWIFMINGNEWMATFSELEKDTKITYIRQISTHNVNAGKIFKQALL